MMKMPTDTIEACDNDLPRRIMEQEHVWFQSCTLSPKRHSDWIASRFYVINQMIQTRLGLSTLYATTSQTIRERLVGAVISAFALPFKMFSPKPLVIFMLHERSRRMKDPYLEVIEQEFLSKFGQDKLMYWGDSRCLAGKLIWRRDVISIEVLKAIAKIFAHLFRFFRRLAWQREFLDSTFSTLSDAVTEKIFADRCAQSFVLRNCYGLLFDMLKPKFLVLTVSYTNIALIQAAKKRGIIVIECQHGLISEHHIGYGCKVYNELSKPDYFGLFGASWTPPEITKQSFVLGAGAKLTPASSSVAVSMRDNSILIISQKSLNLKIRDLIPMLATLHPDKRIVIKLHPSEVNDNPYSGLNVSLASNESFYELAQRADYVIGFYSTVIFELAQADINVNVYPLPGAEMVGKQLPGIHHVQDDFSDLLLTKPFHGEEAASYFASSNTQWMSKHFFVGSHQ